MIHRRVLVKTFHVYAYWCIWFCVFFVLPGIHQLRVLCATHVCIRWRPVFFVDTNLLPIPRLSVGSVLATCTLRVLLYQVVNPFCAAATADKSAKDVTASINVRHRAWVKLHSNGGKGMDAWRPRSLHRNAALKFLKSVDTVLKVGTAWLGLCSLIPDDSPAWSPARWREWPFLSLALDQASDSVSALHCLTFKLKANCDAHYCLSHGVHNDMVLRDVACKVQNLKLACLISLNLPHGPDREEDMRWEQIKSCMLWYLDKLSPAKSELFQARAPMMFNELTTAGLLEPAAGENPSDAVWQWLRAKWTSPRKGYRVNVCEFMRLHR